ncbi:Fic family protein [Wolbachia pipientis]|uniref:Fic family protein n=1 Tax=Wolbachia pipientis TaxID=955 RepID=UPI0025A4C753|nr:Fic family protein [Wolbachia pipientis]MDM8335181.1 Fic family protein [Wolbachia pipientis]
MPLEAKGVPKLMSSMVNWIRDSEQVPCPIIAGIAHYKFVTIYPYYDGNGYTARLLTALISHLCGYDLTGLYSL